VDWLWSLFWQSSICDVPLLYSVDSSVIWLWFSVSLFQCTWPCFVDGGAALSCIVLFDVSPCSFVNVWCLGLCLGSGTVLHCFMCCTGAALLWVLW
jgi:hypothetical protein